MNKKIIHLFLFSIVLIAAVPHIAAADEFAAKIQSAGILYKEQQIEKSFITFLEGLEEAQTLPSSAHEEDLNIYEKALRVYLEGNSPSETADTILKEYEKIAKEHPDYYQLGFIVAISYANSNQFPLFFEKFYHSYLRYPQHHLAYKTKAVLYIKLLAKGRTPQEKEKWRKEVVSNLQHAFDAYPKDTSLCKMLIAFVPDDQKKDTLISCLNKILISNTMIPRTDIAVYVRQAVGYKEKELAQRLVDKAREWYSYSRIVDEAQSIINGNE